MADTRSPHAHAWQRSRRGATPVLTCSRDGCDVVWHPDGREPRVCSVTAPPARILVTGSRNWTDVAAIEDALAEHARIGLQWRGSVVIVHGAARGADAIADESARRLRLPVEPHRADWGRLGRRAGPLRNAAMVARGADVCLAFPLGESIGTRDCMRRAAAAGIPVIDHEPPGARCG